MDSNDVKHGPQGKACGVIITFSKNSVHFFPF
jgi:hypothetical protein